MAAVLLPYFVDETEDVEEDGIACGDVAADGDGDGDGGGAAAKKSALGGEQR